MLTRQNSSNITYLRFWPSPVSPDLHFHFDLPCGLPLKDCCTKNLCLQGWRGDLKTDCCQHGFVAATVGGVCRNVSNQSKDSKQSLLKLQSHQEATVYFCVWLSYKLWRQRGWMQYQLFDWSTPSLSWKMREILVTKCMYTQSFCPNEQKPSMALILAGLGI